MENNFQKFDVLGNDLVQKIIGFDTFYDNREDTYGWFDSSGTTISQGAIKKIIQEIKCNSNSQNDYPTTIITKHDWDLLLEKTPDDVVPLYVTITNDCTYIFNLRKVAEDAEVFRVEEQINYNSTMGANSYERIEEWVYINRFKANSKGYMTTRKGSLAYGVNIDEKLKERRK